MRPRTDYDELWRSEWGDLQRVGPVHRHIQRDLLRVVRSLDVETILDVGCGSGEVLRALAAGGGHELTGVDVSEAAIELAQRRVPAARLRHLDAQRAALAEQFDLVTSIQVLEHLEQDVAALRNMRSMCARYLFVSTMQGRMRPSEASIGHVRNYTPVELRTKLRAAGFSVVWMRGWGFPFYSPIFRTLVECCPGGPPTGAISRTGRILSEVLFQLYRLNVPGRGDVLSALARPA